MVKAVIFDIDGTLVNSVDLHARAWKEAFAKFGHDIPVEILRSQIGKGSDQLVPVFLPPEELKRFGEELEEYRDQLFKSDYLHMVRPFPRVRELLQRVRQDGKRIVLASSAKQDEVEAYKRIAHIEDLVEEQSSAEDAERSKPHPDIFRAALARLRDVSAKEAASVGDSPYDAIAAGKLGIPCVGVLSGGFSKEDLQASGCRAIYRDCSDLLHHYEHSALATREAA